MRMSNGENTIKGYDEFRKLTTDQQAYHIYTQVSKIDNLAKKFASKWVETVVKTALAAVLMTVLGAMMSLIIRG